MQKARRTHNMLLPGDRPRVPVKEFEKVAEMDKELESLMLNKDYDTMYIPSLSVSYREPEEGSLFVKKPPIFIRPLAETGVVCSFDEVEKQTKVEINNIPRPGWEAIQFISAHKLCPACLDVLDYYARYLVARQSVRDLAQVEVPNTDLKSFRRSWKIVALNSCWQILWSIIIISSRWVPGPT